MSSVICTKTWSLCEKRSGKGHSNPHLCGQSIPVQGYPHVHTCIACGEPG
jgi:hypothetical protein